MASQKKNKSKSKKNSPIKSFLRIAELHSDPYRGISKARLSSESKDFHLITKELIKSLKYKEVVVNEPFPLLEQHSSDRKQLLLADKERAFTWTACVVSFYKKQISEFIGLKNEFEYHFIFGNGGKSRDLLDEIESKFNVSMWYINAKFELLQEYDSLRAQKDYLEEIVSVENVDPLIAFIANFISMRLETNISSAEYFVDIKDILELKNLGNYATYHLWPHSLFEVEEPSTMLSYEEDNSIIDRYLALVDMLEVIIARERQGKNVLPKRILRILEGIVDPRLDKLRIIVGASKAIEFVGTPDVYDQYTLGDYVSDIPLSVNNLELIVRQALFSTEKLEKLKNSNSIFSRVAIEMVSMLAKTGDYNKSRKSLEKLRLTVAKTSLARHITHFLSRADNFFVSCERNEADNWFALNLNLENPWIVSTVESISPEIGYCNKLLEMFPNSISVKLQKYMREDYVKAHSLVKSENLPYYREQIYLGVLAHKSNKLETAESHFNNVHVHVNSYVESQVSECRIGTLMAQGKTLQSIMIVVGHYLNNPTSINSYPISELIDDIEKKIEQEGSIEIFSNIHYCLYLSIVSRHLHPKWERNVSDVFENIIDLHDLVKPSELSEPTNAINIKELIYIQRYIAIPRILDDFTEFESVEEVEEERIKICQNLLKIDSNNKDVYASEIRSITKEAKITQLVNHVNASKVYVNEEGVISYVRETLEAMYSQYQLLLEKPEVNLQVDKITERLKVLLNSSEFENLGIPATERMGLFESMYKLIINELALNPAYGLNPHISTTIRHGSFEGQVRRAFDKRELLIRITKGTARDRLPQKWRVVFSEHSDSDIKKLTVKLDTFTKKVIEIIDRYLNIYIQIKALESDREGLFNFKSSRHDLDLLRNSVTVNTTFDEFLNICISRFWYLAQNSMSNIRTKIQSELKPNILKALDALSSGVSADLQGQSSNTFQDDIVRSRIDFEMYVDDLCEWFTKPEQVQIDEFEFDLAFSVAFKQITNCYVTANFNCEKKINVKSSFKGSHFTSFVEILFIFFQNIIRHSSMDELNASLEILESESELVIRIENNLGDNVDIDSLKSTIDKLNSQYTSGNSVSLASEERGSGLSKVWRMLEHDLNVTHDLHIEINNEGSFVVNLKLDTEEIVNED